MYNVTTGTINSVTSPLNHAHFLSISSLKNDNDLFRLLYQPSVHLVEASLSGLDGLSSATGDNGNNMDGSCLFGFLCEKTRKVRTVSLTSWNVGPLLEGHFVNQSQ